MDEMLAIGEKVHSINIMHPMNRKTDLEWTGEAEKLTGVLKDILANKNGHIKISYNSNQLDREEIRRALGGLTGSNCVPHCMNAYVGLMEQSGIADEMDKLTDKIAGELPVYRR